MHEPQAHIYAFENFHVDASKRLLIKGSHENVPLMPKAFDTLLYLVQHSGELIEKDELMREIWTDTIVEENNLTQNISILRRLLGEKQGEHRFIATIPGRGYKFVAEVREVEKQNDQWSVVSSQSEGWRSKTQPAPIKTVAVLPFKPLVAKNRDEALELGMADALISKLSAGEEVTVRPLSAIRKFNSMEQDSVAAGRELNVEAVLDGSIHTSGDRVRVLANLLRVGDGKQLWNGQFDEKFTDIFAVQDSISERVATALKIRLAGEEKNRYTEDIEAYQLYMKGRYHTLRLTRAETDKGIAHFLQAIEHDPDYVLAYVGLAEAYLPMALTSEVSSWEVMPKAKAAALRAIEIDDQSAEAHGALGYILFFYDWDWQAAEKEYLRALEINRNSPEAHFGYAHLLSNTARHEKALAEIRLSREIDPVSLRTNALEGQILFFAGKADEALDRLNKTIDLEPNFWLSHLFISRVYSEKGMHVSQVNLFPSA